MATLEQEVLCINNINDSLVKLYPKDSAKIMSTLAPRVCANIISSLSHINIKVLWPYLSPVVVDNIANYLSDKFILLLAHVLDEIEFSLLLRKCTKERQVIILNQLEAEHKQKISEYMYYPDNTAGSIMRSRFYAFQEDLLVKDVINQIKSKKKRTVNVIYVLDQNLHLIGFINVYKLLIANEDDKLGNLAKPINASVTDMTTQDEVIDIIRKMPIHDLAVVNTDNKLIGVVDSSSLLRSIQDDAYIDLQTMVGVSKDERALSPFFFSVRKRLPWLEINLLTAFLAAFVVGMFEGIIAKFTALAVLLPVVAGQSGNAGAQALAVTMRGLTLREITSKKWLTIALKELRVGLISGIVIAITCAAAVYFWSNNTGLCLVIFSSMIIAMTIACVSGAMVPMVLKKFGLDPAQSSSIVLTTVTDVAGFFAFLGVATLLSNMM